MQNFQLTVQKKDRTIQEYLRLLKLTKTEYQKLSEENKILKEKINTVERKSQLKKEKIMKKRQYKVDTDSKEEQEEEEEERDMQEEKERLKLKKITNKKAKQEKEKKIKPKKKKIKDIFEYLNKD